MKLKVLACCLLMGLSSHSASAASATNLDEAITVTIDLSDQSMRVQLNERQYYKWPVSTGRKGYETPAGTFKPVWLHADHKSSLYDDAPMPWSIFFNGDVAIHGTTDLARLGRPASHGCVRLHPKFAKELFRVVRQVGQSNVVITVQQ